MQEIRRTLERLVDIRMFFFVIRIIARIYFINSQWSWINHPDPYDHKGTHAASSWIRIAKSRNYFPHLLLQTVLELWEAKTGLKIDNEIIKNCVQRITLLSTHATHQISKIHFLVSKNYQPRGLALDKRLRKVAPTFTPRRRYPLGLKCCELEQRIGNK